jgi:dTDP-4-dehydrorhamnose reductase
VNLATSRVVITGGSGFLGGHLRDELASRGAAQVIAPRSSQVDLTDPVATRRLIEQEKPDLVIHLAAKVGGIGANRRYWPWASTCSRRLAARAHAKW